MKAQFYSRLEVDYFFRTAYGSKIAEIRHFHKDNDFRKSWLHQLHLFIHLLRVSVYVREKIKNFISRS